MGTMTIDLVTGEVTTSEVAPQREQARARVDLPLPQPSIQPHMPTPAPASSQLPGGLANVNVERFIDRMQNKA